MYRVIERFEDLQDGGRRYDVGDVFPREGLEVSEERLLELSTSANRRRQPLIEEVRKTAKVKQVEEDPEEEAPKKRKK